MSDALQPLIQPLADLVNNATPLSDYISDEADYNAIDPCDQTE